MSEQQKPDMAKHFYRASAADFMKIPGSPVAYWASTSFVNCFEMMKISDIAEGEGKNVTADNNRFLRFFWEVSAKLVGRDRKWLFYSKGGAFRKWFGNMEFVVDWSPESRDFYRKNHSSRIIEEKFWYRPGITWTDITSSGTGFRFLPSNTTYDTTGISFFLKDDQGIANLLSAMNSKPCLSFLPIINPTLHANLIDVKSLPIPNLEKVNDSAGIQCISVTESDWNSYENSWHFTNPPLLNAEYRQAHLSTTYKNLRKYWLETTIEMQRLEEENNRLFIDAYGLQDELTPEVPLEEITLTCNPYYRYGGGKSDAELETMLQCDTMKELVSYAFGCMMGRYSLDKLGLILASQGETLQDYLSQIPNPRFAPDSDAILPLTDQEWFPDDATNRFREFIRTVWGEETLQENLDFVAESLCLHAIKPKRGESALDTIRRYLSTQFYKDHLRTYKKRPIYWLFSSGKHKAFECLVYLHRYNEGTLARMRTEYVIPLTAKLNTYANKLESDIEASISTAEKKRLEKELATLHNQQAELAAFDEKLRHYADQRISLDLDDGVKVNYGKFGDLLAEVKAVTGGTAETN